MAFSNFGINGSHFKPGKLSLADDVNSSETAVITSSAQGTVQVTTSQLTASYAKIDTLDVNTINSVTTTETTLEVSDAKIIAGLSASSGVNGLQIGGSSTDTELASVLYDGTNLDLNLAGTTYAALSTSKFEVQGVVSGSGQLQGASVDVDGAVSGAAMQGTAGTLTSLNLQSGGITNAGAIAGATSIDGSGDLTMGSITMAEFSVDSSGNTDIDGTLNVEGAATLQSNLDVSGDLTTATITNAEFTVDADGNTDIDGTLNVEGAATMQAALNATGLASLDGGVDVNGNLTISTAGAVAGATSIDGSGDLTMGTITMTGFSVDADGDTALKSLAVDDSSTIGCDSDTDLLTFAAQSVTMAADAALTYKGTAVTSTGAELNLVDGSGAGNVVNSKAVIYSSAGQVAATSVSASSHYEIAKYDGENGMSVLKQEHSENGVTDLIALSDSGDIVLGGFGEFYNGVSSSAGFKIYDTDNAWEVTLNNNGLQNISSMEGNSGNNLDIKQENDGMHLQFTIKQNTKDGESETGHIKFFEGQGEEFGSIQSGSYNGAMSGKIIFGSGSFEHGLNAGTVTVSAAGAIAGATSIDGSGDLTMGSITMAEFTVDSSGNTDIDGTLNVEGAATMQAALNASGLASLDGGVDVNGNVTISTAGAIAGATTIDASGDLTVGTITNAEFTVDASGNTDIDGTLNVEGALTHQANVLPSANGSLNLGSTSYRYNAVYANNVYTGDFHMKNERGDWTLFEESDHIRIRNNKTGQTFKLGMSLIEE